MPSLRMLVLILGERYGGEVVHSRLGRPQHHALMALMGSRPVQIVLCDLHRVVKGLVR